MVAAQAAELNPYIISRPVRRNEPFYGREDVFALVSKVLHEGARVILLRGQRRIGKTSVLNRIPIEVRSRKFHFVNFDLQGQTLESLSQVLYDLARTIARGTEKTVGKQSASLVAPDLAELEQDVGVFSDFLTRVLDALRGRDLVLLLDEFDVLNPEGLEPTQQSFFVFIGNLVSKYDQLHLIPVVGRRLEELPLAGRPDVVPRRIASRGTGPVLS